MSETKYLKKMRSNFNKSSIVETLNKKSKPILNYPNLGYNTRKVGLKRVFENPEFINLVSNIKSRVQKLNREYAIQQSKNENIPEEISILANALNDYTNDLVGHYENSYFKIKTEHERKRFIRDLKLILGTYGELETNLQNIVYQKNNVRITQKNNNENNINNINNGVSNLTNNS